MTAEILTQTIELRNVARQLALWITPRMDPDAKRMAESLAARADALLADVRKVSPAPPVESVYGT